MTLALPPPAAARFAKIVGLLGSDQPGEVVAAAAAASRILREHRLAWADVVRPCPAPPEARQGGGHRARALLVLARGAGRLTPWETAFLGTLSRQVREPSAKQAAVLDRLEARCR